MARPVGPTIEIEASQKVLRGLEDELRNATGRVYRGALRALRRTLASGKSAASKEIRQVINLKKKPVDARIKTKVISARALVGSVAVRDRKVELAEFLTPAQIATAYRRQRGRKSKGVPVKVYKNGPRKVYEGTFLEIGTRSGKWHVLKRKGVEQYPIFIQYGPNMTADFEKKLPAFAARAAETLQRNLERELGAALRGF